jgi:hypothetical protein
MVVLFSLLAVLYIVLLPTRNSSEEMTFAYYILAVPQSITIISAISLMGLLISISLYFSCRLNKPAQLTFDHDKITITGNGIAMSINSKLIDKIFINDLRNSKKELKHKLQILVQPKYGKQVVFQLKDYKDSEPLTATLGNLKNVEFAFYDDNVPTLHHDE